MTISSSYSSSIASTQYTQGTQQKQPPSASDLVSQLMSKSDANEDGLLSVDELSNLSEESFSTMDTNGDGNLSTNELTTSFSSLMESIKNKETSPEEFGNLLSSMGLDVPPPPPPPPPPSGSGEENNESTTTTTSSTTSMEEYTLQLVSTLLEALQSEQSNNSDEESSLDLKKFKEMMSMVNTQTQNGQTANALSEFLKNLTAGVTTSNSSYA
jgi:Ca2+-binding EF-hand superfamily protein